MFERWFYINLGVYVFLAFIAYFFDLSHFSVFVAEFVPAISSVLKIPGHGGFSAEFLSVMWLSIPVQIFVCLGHADEGRVYSSRGVALIMLVSMIAFAGCFYGIPGVDVSQARGARLLRAGEVGVVLAVVCGFSFINFSIATVYAFIKSKWEK